MNKRQWLDEKDARIEALEAENARLRDALPNSKLSGNVRSSAGLDAILPELPTEQQLADACMWESHDFGLCDDAEKRRRMFSMRECWTAIWKALNTPGRGGQYAPPNKSQPNHERSQEEESQGKADAKVSELPLLRLRADEG